MQRRTLLGVAASAGIVGVVGVAGGFVDEPAVPPGAYAEESVVPAREWDHPVVAADTTTAGSEMYGTVRQDASVLDLEAAGQYALIAKYRLIPGANYDASSEWKTTSLTVEHVWRSGSLISHLGDVVPAEDGDADSNLQLDTDRAAGRYRWTLTFNAATGDSRTFRFATLVNRNEPPEEGDSLAAATFGAGFTKGLLRDSERDVATARLAMRETGE